MTGRTMQNQQKPANVEHNQQNRAECYEQAEPRQMRDRTDKIAQTWSITSRTRQKQQNHTNVEQNQQDGAKCYAKPTEPRQV